MRLRYAVVALVFAITALVGCGKGASPSAEEPGASAPAVAESGAVEAGSVLDASYENALAVSSQLALGTMRLEVTGHAITPEQSETLLPLWQAMRGGTLKSEAETAAVEKQIEGTMSSAQLTAIAEMQLTMEDLASWTGEQGLNLSPPQVDRGQGGSGALGEMSDDERQGMRATVEAGGDPRGDKGGPGAPGDLSEEQRAEMRATAEASGMSVGERRTGGGIGQLGLLAEPLIELLTERVTS